MSRARASAEGSLRGAGWTVLAAPAALSDRVRPQPRPRAPSRTPGVSAGAMSHRKSAPSGAWAPGPWQPRIRNIDAMERALGEYYSPTSSVSPIPLNTRGNSQ